MCMSVLSRVQLFAAPMDYSPPGSSVHGIFQARPLEWVAISYSRGSSQPRGQIHISCIAGSFSTTEPPGKPEFWKKEYFICTTAKVVLQDSKRGYSEPGRTLITKTTSRPFPSPSWSGSAKTVLAQVDLVTSSANTHGAPAIRQLRCCHLGLAMRTPKLLPLPVRHSGVKTDVDPINKILTESGCERRARC